MQARGGGRDDGRDGGRRGGVVQGECCGVGGGLGRGASQLELQLAQPRRQPHCARDLRGTAEGRSEQRRAEGDLAKLTARQAALATVAHEVAGAARGGNVGHAQVEVVRGVGAPRGARWRRRVVVVDTTGTTTRRHRRREGGDGERGGREAEEARRQVGGKEGDVDGRTPAEALVCGDLEPNAAKGGGREGGGVGQRAGRPTDALLRRGQRDGHERRVGLERQRPACNRLQLAARTEAAAEWHAAPHVARAQLERRSTAAVGGGGGGGGAVDGLRQHAQQLGGPTRVVTREALGRWLRPSRASIIGEPHAHVTEQRCGGHRARHRGLARVRRGARRLAKVGNALS